MFTLEDIIALYVVGKSSHKLKQYYSILRDFFALR